MNPSDPVPDSVVLSESLPRERLDRHLAALLPGVSRAALQRLFAEDRIRIDGRPVKATSHPRAGDRVEFDWPPVRPSVLEPEEIPLEVLFEDDDLLVINKPAERVVHPGAGHEAGTLVHALLHHCRGTLSGIGGEERPGIVHRLDLGTSGCLVVAKNDAAHVGLAGQFERREVEKTYHCLVCGDLQPPAGEIRARIARHPSHRKRMAVVEGGRTAWTSYRRLELLGAATYVEARLHTGRTHQIRVHFQHIGYPLVGDDTYGRAANRRFAGITGLTVERQMLHARRLAFIHPRTGLFREFDAPLPPDFQSVLDRLRESTATRPG